MPIRGKRMGNTGTGVPDHTSCTRVTGTLESIILFFAVCRLVGYMSFLGGYIDDSEILRFLST